MSVSNPCLLPVRAVDFSVVRVFRHIALNADGQGPIPLLKGP